MRYDPDVGDCTITTSDFKREGAVCPGVLWVAVASAFRPHHPSDPSSHHYKALVCCDLGTLDTRGVADAFMNGGVQRPARDFRTPAYFAYHKPDRRASRPLAAQLSARSPFCIETTMRACRKVAGAWHGTRLCDVPSPHRGHRIGCTHLPPRPCSVDPCCCSGMRRLTAPGLAALCQVSYIPETYGKGTNFMRKPRIEEQIFTDIVDLCTRPGYPHVIAHLSFLNNVVACGKTLTGEDLARMQSDDYLNRNEINALIGCMVKTAPDWTIPSSGKLQEMINASHRLLREYHDRLIYNAGGVFSAENVAKSFDPTSTGEGLREAIFYAAESSYTFQFRDMAAERYSNDAEWIRKNRGYDPNDSKAICKALSDSQNESLLSTLVELRTKPTEEWSMLSGFRLNIREIASKSGVAEAQVEAFLTAFTSDTELRNEDYKQIDDFNQVNVTPIISGPDGELYLFQYYPLVEATYDSPFYWFATDEKYFPTAAKHRGMFTENFLETRLREIFGDQAVFPNVNVYKGKGRLLGEIDCLVLFGEYALLFQAKSQRLTLPARKGKLAILEKDFQRAVQKAYDQAVTCAQAMNEAGVRFKCPDGTELDLASVERVYPICVIADHYPALSMQTRAFLKSESDSKLGPPLVCDLFLMDVMTEMLPSPLRLLSYVTLRAQFGDKIWVVNEHATFGFYLKHNLWIDDKIDLMLINDSMAIELNVAMAVRRDGLPGESIPKGILTKLDNTRLGKIVSNIEFDPNEFAVGMGLAILEMNEESVAKASLAIDELIRDVGRTGRDRDLTIDMEHRNASLTIHVNGQPLKEAEENLCLHMHCRKYVRRAGKWFGLLIEPTTGKLRLGVKMRYPHAFDPDLEKVTAIDPGPSKIEDIRLTKGHGKKETDN